MTVDEEAHLLVGGVEGVPLDAEGVLTGGDGSQVHLLLADVVVDASVEVAVTDEGAEDEVAIAIEVLAAEAEVLPGGVAESSLASATPRVKVDCERTQALSTWPTESRPSATTGL
ncbi:MAG: hypothetical protein R2873_36350 [Caldilineaceae bacterium]